MTDEPTKKTDTAGDKPDTPLENAGVINPILSEAKSLAERIEAGNRKQEELQKKQEQLLAEQTLAGTAGGHIESKMVSEEDRKKAEAKEFFKGTGIEKAIEKHG